MRLNIRLIGLLHGIFLIGMIGYFVLRMSFYSGAGGGRSRDSKGALPIMALGAGLAVVGFRRHLLRQPDQGRGQPAARVPGRLLGRAVHPASRRHRRRAEEDRRLRDRLEGGEPERPAGQSHVLRPGDLRLQRDVLDPSARWASGSGGSIRPGTVGFRSCLKQGDGASGMTSPLQVPRASRAGKPAASTSPGISNAVSQVGQPTPAHVAYAAELIGPPAGAGCRGRTRALRRPCRLSTRFCSTAIRGRDGCSLPTWRRRQTTASTRRPCGSLRSSSELDPGMRLPVLEIALPGAARPDVLGRYDRFQENRGGAGRGG